MKLDGVLRRQEQSPKQATQVHLFVEGNNMQFHIGNEKPFHIRMGDEKAELLEIIDDKGATRPFPVSRLSDSIAGTDVSYEDLTLRFLYWPKAEFQGEEKAADGDLCYKIRLNNPGRDGAYGSIFVWVHKKWGAFWQIRTHDRKGVPIKEFQVTKAMKVPGGKGYTIQQMRVNKLAPDSRVQSVTYLEFEDPGGAAKPKGRAR